MDDLKLINYRIQLYNQIVDTLSPNNENDKFVASKIAEIVQYEINVRFSKEVTDMISEILSKPDLKIVKSDE